MKRSILVVEDEFKNIFHGLEKNIMSPYEYIMLREDEKQATNVYNLSSGMNYQGEAYYVSLLAMARNHKVYPDPVSIQDLKDRNMQKYYSNELMEIVQRKFSRIKSSTFELSVYFGKNLAGKYDDIAWDFFRAIRAPMFRVYFERLDEQGSWNINKIKIINLCDIHETHHEFLRVQAIDYLKSNSRINKTKNTYKYDMAILVNPEEGSPPSDEVALQKFIDAGKRIGIKAELIVKKDRPNISEYDALFIRETTSVPHHTYRMSRKAASEGLVVIDDPDSIIRCTNKVFLEELLDRLNLKRPKSSILNDRFFKEKKYKIEFPCVIKQPDSAFSQGVHKAENDEEFEKIATKLLKHSELILVQEFLYTDYDWRVGILDGQVIYACKYYMAENHWQIIKNNDDKSYEEGNFECLDPSQVDSKVLNVALKAAKPFGKGLYGVDLKQKGKDIYVIEVNDNPSIEHGVEDGFLGDRLYDIIMGYFLRECDKRRGLYA